MEEARTNLLTYSEQFDNAAWVKTRATVTGASINAAVAPNGTVTADNLVEDSTASNTHFISSAAASVTSGAAYTASLYVKLGQRNVSLSLPSGAFGANVRYTYDLTAGTATQNVAGTGDSATITQISNGWWRVTLTATATASTTAAVTVYLISGTAVSYTGDGTSGLYLWGAQLE